MYYYHNTTTGESQWEYPTLQEQTPVPTIVAPFPPTVAPVMVPTLNASNSSLVSPAYGFSRDPVQTNTKVKKKKRVVQEDASQVEDPYRDPYRQLKRSKKETSLENSQSGNESGTSSPLPTAVIAAAPQILRSNRESSPSIISNHAMLSNPSAMATSQIPTQPSLMVNPPLSYVDSVDGTQSPMQPKEEKKILESDRLVHKQKIKKKKKLESTGLVPSKKLKKVSSLVQKWQSVKQQAEEEENVELESEDEDYEQASERRIEEWKSKVEASGEKDYNPNFMEIKSDWRQRLKRKT